MRIERLAIEGFGRLHQQEIDLRSPVTMLLGPNEAGKSTTAAFIRTMLYGFPQRRSGAERYEPLAGGRHGGQLVLSTDDGERLTVERFDGRDGLRIWDEAGNRWSESDLQRAIGGYPGDLFQRMFAFSLKELQEIRLLESEDVGRYLYTVGLGRGDGKSILEAERKLTVEMEQLFKYRGSVQPIPQKAREVEELATQLQAARGQSEAYNALLEQLEQCGESMQAAASDAARIRTELNWLAACIEAREDWIALRDIEKRLASMPKQKVSLPENGLEQLNRWREQEERLREDEGRVRQQLERRQSEHAELVMLEGRDKLRQRLERLLEQLISVSEDLNRLKEMELELHAREEEAARCVRAVSPDWTSAQLRAYPMSQAEAEQVRAYRDAQARLQAAADRLETERREREVRCHTEKRSWDDARIEAERLLAARRRYPELADIPYAERVQQIRQYLRESARWAELAREYRHTEDRLTEAQHIQAGRVSMQHRSPRTRRRSSSLAVTVWTMAGWGGAAAGIAGFGAAGEWTWAAVSAILGGVMIAVARLGPWARQQPDADERTQHVAEQEPIEQWRKRLRDIEQRCEQAAAVCQELLIRLLPAGSHAAAAIESHDADWQRADGSHTETSLSARAYDTPSAQRQPSDWADWREQLEELLPLEEKLQQCEERLDERERAWRRAEDEFAHTQAREADNKAAADAEQVRWEQWLSGREFAPDTSPEAALVLLQLIEKGQHTAREAERYAKQAALLRERISAFDAAVRSLYTEFPQWMKHAQAEGNFAARDSDSEPSIAASAHTDNSRMRQLDAVHWASCLKGLQQKLQEQDELARHAARLEEQIAEDQAALAVCEQSQARIHRERVKLLQEAHVDTEHEWRKLADDMEERERCLSSKEHLLHVLQVRLGGKPLAQLEQVWLTHTLPEVRTKLEEWERELQLLSDEQQELMDNKAKLQAELDRLMRDEEYAALLQAHKEAKTELKELAAKWTVRAMAQAWFRQARETYEQERQPAVMQKASARFSQLTGGVYSRVYTTIGEGKLEVEHASGTRLEPGQLSRGTCEQLLLAIRFALAESTADRMAMPLLMDDVFVNFDPARLEKCWDIVNDMSDRHQFVYFTCHPHIAEAAQRRSPAVKLLHI